MKSVLISIQPYWVYLIIARKIGLDIPLEKTVEVRKNCPKGNAWNKTTNIYCTKDRKSFDRIPKQYQPIMEKYLGKVIGEFVCDNIIQFNATNMIAAYFNKPYGTCLTDEELVLYSNKKPLYGWHISDLVIYDKPKDLNAFWLPPEKYCEKELCGGCPYDDVPSEYGDYAYDCEWKRPIKRPPQSWCYVERLSKGERCK